MQWGRNARETAAYERLMYPGAEPRVPVNRLDIRDATRLHAVEFEITTLRMQQGLPHSALSLTCGGYLEIHRHLFQDLYEWAGQLRPYTTARNVDAPFAAPENITTWMQRQFAILAEKNLLRDLELAVFADELAPLANELNAAHPFIEGNGRVLRLWLQIVADGAGYTLNLDRRHASDWNEASRIGFLSGDPTPLARLLRGNLSPCVR